jgi:type IV pilus assembly protein PilM
MASKSSSVWAIDIGNNSLKALQLSGEGETVEVLGFDSIQHGKILSGTGVKEAERDELIAISLRRLVEQNDLGKEDIIISVASQNSFARFVNLPPVEKKRIPEIVKFEASQQIPFDINDVQWDWQLMNEPGEGEAKVGIFAIKNEIVDSVLDHFHAEGLKVKYVQMAPMALYNYILHDNKDWSDSENHAIVILDVGAENTDLVVCTKSAVWQRCIHKGGNAFTKAIANAFKLSFERAEKLKRTAAMSKYARQTYQAIRPVFSDLASEIQRSLNFFNSSNPDANISKVIAVGGGTKMRGLLKYLRQSLQLPVERPETFHQARLGSGVSAAKFHEIVPDFSVVYSLGLQALGYGKVESKLLPSSLARSMAWAGKAKYFTLAACIFFCVSVLAFARTYFDHVSYEGKAKVRSEIAKDIRDAKNASNL